MRDGLQTFSKDEFCSEENFNKFPCNMNVGGVVSFALIGALLALIMSAYLTWKLKSYDRGSPLMVKLADAIASGSRSFLVTEYKYLAGFVTVVFVILFVMFSLSSNR
jgi:Na+/H+-translocating membrane pyrophosphatase